MKKKNRVLQRFWAVVLSVMVSVCSTPVVASATILDADSLTISADAISKNTVPEADVISEEAASADSVVEDIDLVDSVSDDAVLPDDGPIMVDEPGEEISRDGSLKIGENCFINFNALGGSYNSVPSGYRYDGIDPEGNNWYIQKDAIVMSSKDTTFTLLPEPDNIPTGKLFVGWTGLDGDCWIASSTILVGSLKNVFWEGNYDYSAKYSNHIIDYDLNGGEVTGTTMYPGELFDIYRDSKNPNHVRQDGGYIVTVEKKGCTFLGWTTNGSDLINPQHSSELDFGKLGNVVRLKAVYSGEPIKPTKHTLTLAGIADIDQGSLDALKGAGFTVKDTIATKVFTSTDSKFYLPTLSKDDAAFLGWYKTGQSSSTATPYVEFDPSIATDVSYTASFKESVSVSLRSSFTLYEGQSFKLVATVRPEGANQNVTWSNSNSSVADLNSGTIKAKNEGTCIITATSVADASKKATCKVTVLKSEITDLDEHGNPINPGNQAIDDETGEMNIWVAGLNTKGYYYTGNPIKPQIHIYDGAKLLALDTDYVLSYKNNVRASTGVTKDSQRPQIIIKMLGKRTGSKVVYFNILPTPIDKLVAEDSTLCATYTKKGNQLKPALVCEGTNVKYSDKDITFKYFEANSIGAATGIESTCVDPGLYAVKAYAGQSGNFTSGASGRQVATIKVYGKVSMSSVKINGFKTKLLYNNGAPITQSAVSLAYKSDVLQEGVDYTVTYENNYNIGTATVTYEAVKDSAGNYTGDFAGKVSKVFSISGRYILKTGAGGNATITLARDYYEFTNAAIKPVVKVTVNAVNDKGEPEVRTLVEGKDYVVACKNNKAVADANAIKAPQVIIKGKGYYQFEDKAVTKNFTITKPDLSSLVLTISDKPYSNKPNAYKSTKITFTDRNYNDLKLKAGKDYTIISYITSDGSDTPASGETVYVSIAAKEGGSYTGNKTGEYRITGPMYTDISKAKAVINPGAKGKATACAYTGDEIKPGQTGQPGLVLTAGSKKLRLGTDYEIVGYYNNIAPGKRATVLIRGIGNCRGIRAINFVITTKPVSQHWGGVYGQ